MPYPTKMEANGHIYPINTDYRVALACLRAIGDTSITDLERFYACESLLLGYNVLPQDEYILKSKIKEYLMCGREENNDNSEIDMDYFQDEKYIRTSIKQVYHGLDILKLDYLHWYEFNELIEGLTTDSVLERIRELRTYDVSNISDEKEKQRIIKAKEKIALKKPKKELTKSQKESVKRFYELTKITPKRK